MAEELFDQFAKTERLLHRYYQLRNPGGRPSVDPRHGQGRIITLLKKIGEVTQSELSYLLDIRPQSLGELLQKLEGAGYISRQQDPEDRRRTRVCLTEKGAALEMDQNDMSSAFACLNEEEQESFGGYLTRVSDSLEEQLKNVPEDRRRPCRPPHFPGDFPPPPPRGEMGGFPRPPFGACPPPHGGPGFPPPPHEFEENGFDRRMDLGDEKDTGLSEI